MRIEEFLRKNGKKYNLRVINIEGDELRIEVQTLKWDGDGSTEEFIVKDNLFFPLGYADTNNAPKKPIT